MVVKAGEDTDTESVSVSTPTGPESMPSTSESRDTGTVSRALSMFGGGTLKKQVRKQSTPNKKCVRSKLNRCLVHRCQFVEEERSRRVLGRDEGGKVAFKMIKEKVWRCQSQNNEECSLPSSNPNLGGKFGGRTDVQNEKKHMGRIWNSAQP